MDQLKQVKNYIYDIIHKSKSTLGERIRYEHYLDCLYKIVTKQLKSEPITQGELINLFEKYDLKTVPKDEH